MKTLATTLVMLAIALAFGSQAFAARHHHHAKHHPAHVHNRIRPGGDQDSDNHGAPSDGDGDL